MNNLLVESNKRNGFLPAVLIASLIVGTLDISAALLQYFITTGKNPLTVLKFIASGVFGKEAFSGNRMAAYGLLFHYLIAFLFTILFFTLYPRLKHFLQNNLLIGILYGLVIWIVMDLVVLPFTNAPALPFTITGAIIAASILIVAIGIPLSFIAQRFYRYNKD
jgi:hypothetical protein